jgi:hypothetical protein
VRVHVLLVMCAFVCAAARGRGAATRRMRTSRHRVPSKVRNQGDIVTRDPTVVGSWRLRHEGSASSLRTSGLVFVWYTATSTS